MYPQLARDTVPTRMSEEEVLGHLVVQYKDANARLAKLRAEAEQFSHALGVIASALSPRSTGSTSTQLERCLETYPTSEAVRQLLAELDQAGDEVNRVKQQLSNLGIPMKD